MILDLQKKPYKLTDEIDDYSVQSVDISREKSRTIKDGISDNTEDMDECNISVENTKDTPSNAAFDPHKPCPDVRYTIGLVSTRSMLENPMLGRFKVNQSYFSSQVAGKLLVFKQENEGSMVVNNIPK